MHCDYCASTKNQVKSGYNGTGTQRYLCKECGSIYTPKPACSGHPLKIRRKAQRLYANGESARSVARTLGISPQSVINWLFEDLGEGDVITAHDISKGRRLEKAPKGEIAEKRRRIEEVGKLMKKVMGKVVIESGEFMDSGEFMEENMDYSKDGYWSLFTVFLRGNYYEGEMCFHGTGKKFYWAVRLAKTMTKEDFEKFEAEVRRVLNQRKKES
jgi:hypothetical protein